VSARGADTQVRPYAKAGIQQSIEVEKGKQIAALIGQGEAADAGDAAHPSDQEKSV